MCYNSLNIAQLGGVCRQRSITAEGSPGDRRRRTPEQFDLLKSVSTISTLHNSKLPVGKGELQQKEVLVTRVPLRSAGSITTLSVLTNLVLFAGTGASQQKVVLVITYCILLAVLPLSQYRPTLRFL